MPAKLLTEDEIDQFVSGSQGWRFRNASLIREFRFRDFVTAIRFVDLVAESAERANHHPDIDIRYNLVILVMSTHDSGGVTDNDLQLAKLADQAMAAVTG